jgi:hypothetical protein
VDARLTFDNILSTNTFTVTQAATAVQISGAGVLSAVGAGFQTAKNRRGIILANNGAAVVYIGPSSSLAGASGSLWAILPGNSEFIPANGFVILYAYTPASTSTTVTQSEVQ